MAGGPIGACDSESTMRPIEQAIWLIESRLQDAPKLDDIARETGLSRFYISCLFAEETGTTLAAYVRARRLSEAAKVLLAGAPNILDVAIGAGYGSHEAFTRAFKAQFDLTPEELRARGLQQPLQLKEPLRMNATQHRARAHLRRHRTRRHSAAMWPIEHGARRVAAPAHARGRPASVVPAAG